MYKRRLEPTVKNRRAHSRDGLRHGVCALALVGGLGFAPQVAAQDNPIVDISDPNVSIDLSVLNDGGLSPQMGAPLSSTGAAALSGGAAYQAPGKDMPVSTLYIKPASGYKLPPQTKSIETQVVKVQTPAPVSPPDAPMAEAPMPEPAPVAPVAETDEPSVADAVAQLPPAPVTPPALEAAAPETTPEAAPEAAPEPAPEPAMAPVEVAEAQPVAPAPAPAPAPAAPAPATPEPAAAPEPTPVVEAAPEPASPNQPMALNTEPPAGPAPTPAPIPAPIPTPEQTVATAPTPPPAPAPVAERDETQTAPMTSQNGGVVIPVPPKPDTPAQVASLPPASGPLSDGDNLRIVFDADTSKLAQPARDALLDVATKMQSQNNLRLQLLAYAGTADTSASAARRLSLSRALAVRSFLIENGVRSTRIDVRALGNKSTDEVTERVDITVVER